MTPPRPSTFRPAPLALALLTAAALASQEPEPTRLLLDRTLSARRVAITSLSTDSISYTTSTGLPRTEPTSEFVAFLTTDGHATPAIAPFVQLADGLRFPGEPQPARAGADSLRWRSTLFDGLVLPLDAVRSVVFSGSALRPPDAPRGDLVILANGDRLLGFVEQVGATVRLDADGSVIEVEAGRVRAVHVDNPPRRPEGLVAWLADGTVASLATLRPRRDGSVTLELRETSPQEESTLNPTGPRTADVPIGALLAAAFKAESLLPLASLEPVSATPVGSRRWLPPLPRTDPDTALLGAAPVELPGPMSITWTLPPGAARFGAAVTLPDSCRPWGDCELVVSAGAPGREPAELLRRRFNAADSSAEVSVPLPAGPQTLRLRLTLEPGEYGPVQDRLVLERPLILLAPPEP